jgi:hypothetical protein
MTKTAASMLLLTTVLALSACHDDPCKATSKCSADPPPSPSQVSQCEALLSEACGSQFRDLGNCEESNQVCAGNQTDTLATSNATAVNCSSEQKAWNACCTANPTACTQ